MENTFVYKFDKNLYINLTNRCSNDCTFCLRNNGEGIGEERLWIDREPTINEVKAMILTFDPKSYNEIVFCGYGESTYRLEAVLVIADFAHELGKKTRLDTNGLGNEINGMDIVPLIYSKIDTVSISLNECDSSKYQKVSRSVYGEQAYDIMLDFAKKCVAIGINTIMTVVDVIPKEDIIKCKEIAETIGAGFRIRQYIS